MRNRRWSFAGLVSLLMLLAWGGVASGAPAPGPGKRKVAILVYPGAEVLDFSGPAEVFYAAEHGDAFEVFTVAETREPVLTQGRVTVRPRYTFADAPRPDVLIVPGGSTDGPRKSAATLAWLTKSAAGAQTVLTVCTGSFIAAQAGLADGQTVTTHHNAVEELRKFAPRAKVIAHRRFVESGKLITSGGVTAGIDGALHVVSRLLGPEAARWVAEDWMEYGFAPDQNQHAIPADTSDMSAPAKSAGRRNVAALLYPGVGQLDLAGALDAFYAADHGRAFNVYTVASDTSPVASGAGLELVPQYALDAAPPPDILLVPGGSVQNLERDQAVRDWLGRTGRSAQVVVSVGSGALALAHAGLIADGSEVTTHAYWVDGLKRLAPRAQVVEGRRFVDAGKVVTAGGPATGMDAALHVIDRLHGREVARWAAEQWMEYRWEPGQDRSAIRRPERRKVAILLYDGVELLDFAGPGEVFKAAGDGRAFEVFTVAATAEPVLSQGFVSVKPQYTIADSPDPHILVVPGGDSRVPLRDDKTMAWIERVTKKTEIAFSVCTGAFLLAKLGLVEGREATTHWAAIERFRAAHPNTRVTERVRYVDAGPVVTTAGVSAGIDGALHVVERLLGRPAAEKTARYMEYEWKPSAGPVSGASVGSR